VDGQEMLVTHTRSAVNEWLVVNLVPYTNVTSSADTIQRITLAVLAVSFVFITLVVWIVSRTVVKPLTNITESFQQIQKGVFDWHIRLDEKRTDEIGEMMRWFNMFLNSMEAKNMAEQELVKAKEAAEAGTRAKSNFLANMSHELRTPLNAILGFSELMSKDQMLDASQRENIETINRSGEHLLGLINDILDLSKIESGRMDLRTHTFDLYNMMHELGKMFEVRARQKGLGLIVESAPDAPRYINTDEGKLRQVLINLLGNAVKFTKTGAVTLRVNLANGNAQNYSLHFSVEDTGVGITSKDLGYIFEPFAQSKDNLQPQGTGLGLAISRQHVELLGGSLQIKSEAGAGSIFSFEIPVGRGVEEDVAISSKRVASIVLVQFSDNGGLFRLLIAEDVDVNRRFLVKLLSPLGFDVREAVNGEEALSIWETWQPHLIYMDMRMPILNGLEVTRRIKATPQGKKTVIVMLTASAFEEDRAIALSQGCDDFIHKPVRENQIFESLQKYLGVQFIYEPVVYKTAQLEKFDSANPAWARDLSTEWKEKMLHAVVEADVQKMQDLIDEIEAAFPDLSKALTDMVYRFDYVSIRALIAPNDI